MNTYKELVYMVLDETKLHSDDSSFTEDHIIYLLDKYRAFILKQRYADIKKAIPESNYQTICLPLELVGTTNQCGAAVGLKSKDKIPYLMKIGHPSLHTSDYYDGEITYVSRDRMKYVGHNKYMQNIIYASIGPDNYLYLTSANTQYTHLEEVQFTGIFEDPKSAAEYSCQNSTEGKSCNIYDSTFPIEDALVPVIIELVVKELLGASYRPKDDDNDAKDALADLANYIARNVKSNLAKQLQE